ncbi:MULTISPECIES: glycosyltransferase family 2 protein [unclassified Lacrimispora]|uniref:glycosyltransferase family 2 protein n=1 Tax=unclassified Lacrimispora TaxID=2719232 RepID=UPI00377028F0
MSEPLVSVIIPVYNAASYICKCIDSVLNQTYTNIEIILVNDGSKDESDQIIRQRYANNSCVKYCNKKNEGVSKARNVGLRMSSGDFITFIDSDDWVNDHFVEEAVRCLITNKLDFVLGGTEKVFPKHTVKCAPVINNGPVIYENNIDLFEKKILSNGVVDDTTLDVFFTSGPVCKLFRREKISGIEFDEDLVMGEDVVFNLEVMQRVNRVGVVPRIWYYYRMNDSSATRVYNPKIVSYTEKLLYVLQKMYGSKEEYLPYLIVRYVQQFHGMLYLGPLSRKSQMSFSEKRIFIRTSLEKECWRPMMRYSKVHSLPMRRFDKVLLYACTKRNIILVMAMINMRMILKGIRSK